MENMKTHCYFYVVFCAHPFEYHEKKSLPSHNLNFNMIFLYILW